jgi:hypothetical protein
VLPLFAVACLSEYIPSLTRGSCMGLLFVTSYTRGGVKCPPDQAELEIDKQIEQRNVSPRCALASLQAQTGTKQQ